MSHPWHRNVGQIEDSNEFRNRRPLIQDRNRPSVVLTGGGLKTGQVLGSSNARAEIPQDRPIHYNDVLATIYRQLGIATDRVFMHDGRPVPILYQGTPIPELI